MSNIVQFKSKPVRNIYVVDNFYVVLAHSEEEALSAVLEREGNDYAYEVVKLDDQKEVNVIKSGKVEIILWMREPKGLEQLRFKLRIREFIDKDLKNHAAPSIQDYLEDSEAEAPKK